MRRASLDLGENHETGKIKRTKAQVGDVVATMKAAKEIY
jgi:hypothetical protein